MGNFSLDPIIEALKPVLNKFKTATLSTLLVMPVIVHSPVNTENKTPQINKITRTVEPSILNLVEFHKFTQELTDLVQLMEPVLDFGISLVPISSQIISDDELNSFAESLAEYQQTIPEITQKMAMYHLTNNAFIQALENFGNKMTTFYQAVKSEKYKRESDKVILSRAYQGSQSVGYTYKENHSFDEFKKALLG